MMVLMFVLSLVVAISGYFVKMVHSDVRKNTLETGKNKGKIEQLQIQLTNHEQMNEIRLKNQQENTEKAIELLTKSVKELSEDVRMLINYKIKKTD